MKKGDKVRNKLEIIVDLIIPYLVIILLLMIIAEVFFHKQITPYHYIIVILDYIIVGVFVLDLYFKYKRIKNFKKFLRESWLDIIAVFPFFLLFRVYEEIALILRVSSTELRQSQSIFHELLEIEKSAAKWSREATTLAEEAERVGKISRSRYLIRVVRPIARIPRLFKAFAFFERPVKKRK